MARARQPEFAEIAGLQQYTKKMAESFLKDLYLLHENYNE